VAQRVRLELSRASQFANGPSGGQGTGGACRDGRRCRGGSRLEGFVTGEYVPAGDQDLAGDGGLGGVAVSLPAADIDVQSVPGGSAAASLAGRPRPPPNVRAASRPSTAVRCASSRPAWRPTRSSRQVVGPMQCCEPKVRLAAKRRMKPTPLPSEDGEGWPRVPGEPPDRSSGTVRQAEGWALRADVASRCACA